MRISRQSSTTNPSGGLKIIEDKSQRDYKREDFFRTFKEASRRASEKPSQSGSQTR